MINMNKKKVIKAMAYSTDRTAIASIAAGLVGAVITGVTLGIDSSPFGFIVAGALGALLANLAK